jgi:hypothetical protein
MRRRTLLVSALLVLLGTAALAAGARPRPLPRPRGPERPGSVRLRSFDPHDRFDARLARRPARAGGLDTLPEFRLDTLRIFGASPAEDAPGGIAAGGSNCLAVWTAYSGRAEIIAARLTAEGAVIDSTGFRVSPAGDECFLPAAGFDGTNWLVAWMRVDTLTYIPAIHAARVSPDGVVLDPAGIAVSTGDWEHSAPAVGFDGTNWLVAWTDFRSGGEADVYAARITPAGAVLDPAGIAVSTAAGNQATWSGIANDGTNSLIAWHDDRNGNFDIYAARVTPAGAVLDPAGIRVTAQTAEQGLPCAAFDGANYLLAWLDDRAVPDELQVFCARLTPAGTVLDPAGILVSGHPAGFGLGLTFGGGNYLASWSDHRGGMANNVYAARISPAGTVLDPAGIALSPGVEDHQDAPAVCFAAGGYVAAWADYRNWNADIYAARVLADGTVPDSARLVTWGWSSPYQQTPAAAFDGANWLAVWMDGRDEWPGIYGTRVTPGGSPLDPQGLAVATGGQYAPAIAFGGTNHLVVWEEASEQRFGICAARVSPAGIVLDPQGIPITGGVDYETGPAVAFDGSNWLVAWAAQDEQTKSEIRAARVTPAGAVLATAVIHSSDGFCDNPSVAAGPGGWLVTWDDDRDNDRVFEVYAARVSPGGVVLDPQGIAVATGDYDRSYAAVASDGTNWLVAWAHDPDGSYSFDIYAARVSPEGTVLDPAGIPVMATPEDQYAPTVAFNGSAFQLAWQDDPWLTGEIRGGRVSSAGVVLDPGGVPLVRGPFPRFEPRLSPDCGLLVFTGYVSEVGAQKALAVLMPPAAVADRPPARPSPLRLSVRPSPARGPVTVSYSLPGARDVTLAVHDVAGRLVRTLARGRCEAGHHAARLAGLPAGVYLVRLEAGRAAETRKLVIE